MIEAIAGISAFVCVVASELTYIWGMWKGEVRPSRSSYWLWSFLHGGIALSYFLEGGSWAVLFSCAYALMFLIVAIHSIRFGEGKWVRLDSVCLSAAMFSVGIWLLTGSALIGLICFFIADFAGAIPTLKKSWLRPESEQILAWGLTFLATLIDLAAVGEWQAVDIMYQIYFILLNGTLFIFVSRKSLIKFFKRV